MASPKLKGCGGFELLQCTANCRDLEVLKCVMSVNELKNHISGQGKIYIRPIQGSLSTIPLVAQGHESKIKEKCSVCSDIFYVKDLRKHFLTCCPPALLEKDEFESFRDTSEGTGQTANSISSNSIQYHQNIGQLYMLKIWCQRRQLLPPKTTLHLLQRLLT